MHQAVQAFAGLTLRRYAAIGTCLLWLSGCQALAVTAAGIGASTGLSHTANSISDRTFTASEAQVRHATLLALERMGVKVEGRTKQASGELLRASVADRSIEIELESLNAQTTRISASAQRGLFVYDGATAREIIAQTEAVMVELSQPRRPQSPARASTSVANSSPSPIRR
jgi:Protein of unknown function (DUF3568)